MKMLKGIKIWTYCLAAAATTLLSGCATEMSHPMTSGVLATPGCQIIADDNTFTLVSNQEFQPAFQIDENSMVKFLGRYYGLSGKSDLSGLVNFPADALAAGAERVRVTVPGRTEPLYGVLALFEILNSGTGPGSRSYRIEIPQQYVDAATEGRVSVVYETYPGQDQAFPSWVLWLSDQPFEALALPEVKHKRAR